MAEIIVDYNRIRQKAEEVGNTINTLYGYNCELENTLAEVKKAWTGTASEEMQKKLGHMIDDVKEDIYKYYDLRDALRKTADDWEKKERELQQKAESSKKKG